MKSLFVLEMNVFYKKRRKHRDDYPNIEIQRERFSYHQSIEEAEKMMRSMIKEKKEILGSCGEIYCFYIHELPLNHILYINRESYSTRMYDRFGIKQDERLYKTFDYNQSRCFKGRPKEKQRFKIGDVVEVQGDLYVVISTPREELPVFITRTEDGYCYWGDESDDSCTLMGLEQRFDEQEEGVDHIHVECIDIMFPQFPISDKVQQKINKVKNWYFNHNDK